MPLLLLMSLAACQLDPRPTCSYRVEVDPFSGIVEIVEAEGIVCLPAEDPLPNAVSFEALGADPWEFTADDLDQICSDTDYYGVLELHDLPGPVVDLFDEDPPGTLVYSDLSRAVDGAWLRVSFLQEGESGGFTGVDGWTRLFQLGGEDVVTQSECRSR